MKVSSFGWNWEPGAYKQRLPLALDYVFSSGSLLISSIAQLVTFAILARHLGVDQFGLLVTITAITSLGVHLCGLGAAEPLVRRVAREPAIYPLALGHNLILIALTGGVLTVILTLVLWRFYPVTPEGGRSFLTMFCLVLSNVVLVRWILLGEQIYIAFNNYRFANSANVGFALGRTATAIVACYGFATHDIAHWAFWHMGGHLLMAGVAVLALRPLGRPRWGIMADELRLGAYFSSQNFFLALRQNADLLILGSVAPSSIVGSYGVARRILDVSTLATSALHRLVYPKLAVLGAGGVHKALGLARKILLIVVAIAMLTSAAVYTLAPLLPLFFGKDFTLMVHFTRTICWAGVLMAVRDVASETLGATSNHGIRAFIYNVGGVIGTVLVAILTHWFWANGAMTSLYLVELAFAIAFWMAIARLVDGEAAVGAVAAVNAKTALADEAAQTAPAAAEFKVRVASSLAEFADIWPDGCKASEGKYHVFQCAEFLDVWVETIAKARRTKICFTAVSDASGRPLLLIPFGIEQRGLVRVLTFLDGDVSDYNTPVLFETTRVWDQASVDTLWRSLIAALPPFDVAELGKMGREEAGRTNPLALLAVTDWPVSGHTLSLSRPWQDLVATQLPRRRQTRQKMQALRRIGEVTYEVAETDEQVTRILNAMFEQKHRRFNETRVPGFEIAGTQAFFTEATRRFAKSGLLHLAALKAGEEIIATGWSVRQGSRLYFIILGYAGAPWQRFSPGRLLIEHILKWSHDEGISLVDFGIGDEAYKLEYTDGRCALCGLEQALNPLGHAYLWYRATLKRLRANTIWRKLRPFKWLVLRSLDSQAGDGSAAHVSDKPAASQ